MVETKKIFDRPELRKARRVVGLTQTRLARNLRVTTSAVSAWEAGTRNPSAPLIPRLADELEVSPDVLLGWIDAPAVGVNPQ